MPKNRNWVESFFYKPMLYHQLQNSYFLKDIDIYLMHVWMVRCKCWLMNICILSMVRKTKKSHVHLAPKYALSCMFFLAHGRFAH